LPGVKPLVALACGFHRGWLRGLHVGALGLMRFGRSVQTPNRRSQVDMELRASTPPLSELSYSLDDLDLYSFGFVILMGNPQFWPSLTHVGVGRPCYRVDVTKRCILRSKALIAQLQLVRHYWPNHLRSNERILLSIVIVKAEWVPN
jgi:hypothetical protein